MNSQIIELIGSFDSDTKILNDRYNQFLLFVHFTFDKKIRNIKSQKLKDKYKKIKNDVLQYISTHKEEMIEKLR
jgi:hypothetical protein|tara:strand:+ start:1095 stop:1316 length:222 start_codon:yes stop_codon:yes gene_type:complete